MKRANGEGSVFRRTLPNGRVQYIAVTASPECRRFTSTKSQADAIRKRADHLRRARGSLMKASARQPFGEFLDGWMASAEKGLAPASVALYTLMIRKHIKPHAGDVPLAKIGPAQIRAILDEMGEHAPATIRKVRSVLKRALDAAVEWDLVAANPVTRIKGPKLGKPDVRPLEMDERAKFITYLVAHDETLALVYTLMGVRTGEALGLAWRDVDLDKRTALFTQQIRRQTGKGLVIRPILKTPTSHRTLKLPKVLVESLKAHRRRQLEARMAAPEWVDTGLVFTSAKGGPLEPKAVLAHVRRLMAATGVSRLSIRALRHTALTYLLRSGVPIKEVQAVSGHSSATVLLDTYAHHLGDTSLAADVMDDLVRR